FGGTMNNPLVYDLFHMYHKLGCTTVRFNFRGVGRSQGTFDSGVGELSDAAAVLDWMNTLYPNPSFVWVCGISFGAWIGMQLLMRRPEITGFISIAPPASMYDFAFLAPCPASGIMIHGTKDQVVPEADVLKLVDRLRAQKGIKIDYHKIEGANHFFDKHEQDVVEAVEDYSQRRMNDPNRGR
ncbi:MAG TPA: alpha/beta hydrolase, partial [Rhizomicrobium sp.]